jgi:hypothetical protein
MNIPTANVIIGFEKETMSRLFEEGATYTSLIKGLSVSGSDTLLFDNESNPNFISFEHSLNMGGGMKMKLEFIDPEGEFEKRYITDNSVKNIAGFMYNDTQNIDRNVFSKKVNKGMKESASDYSEQYYSDILQEYKKQFRTKEVYVAYGSGNNLNLWSGPHRTMLTGADISVKGPRKITLTLTPTAQALNLNHRRGAYNEKVNLNLAGMTMRYSGESQKIKFQNLVKEWQLGENLAEELMDNQSVYNPLEYLDLEQTYLITEKHEAHAKLFGALGLNDLASTLGEFDFHSIIVDALRSYIQKATNNPNVIVLLPNINLICRKLINETAKNARIGWDTSSQEVAFGSFNMQSKMARSLEGKVIISVGAKEQFISNFLQSLGCELHSVIRDSIMSSSDLKAIPQQHISALENRERKKNADERMKSYYKDRDFYGIIQKSSSDGIPDHMAVVRNVLNSIKKHSKEDYQLNIAYFTETDLNVLDLWSKNTGTLRLAPYHLFGGYDLFNETKEAVIVGDLALIQEYLYGKINLKAKQKTLDDLKLGYTKAKQKAKSIKENIIMDTEDSEFAAMQSSQVEKEVNQANKEAEGYIVAAMKNIPLHPLDKYILTNVMYNKKIRAITNPPLEGDVVGSFGDISYIPEEFAYQDSEFSKVQKKYIEENAIPVFRYNTTNPNVLDLNFKFGGIYFANLAMGFQKMVERKASGVAGGVLPIGTGSFPIRSRGHAIAYLRSKDFSLGLGDNERKEAINALAASVSPELLAEMETNDPAKAADAIAAKLDLTEQTDYKGYIEVDQLLPGNPQSIMTDFAEDMYRKALQMQIKTLPTFHLSNVHTINDPCILFAQDAEIKQTLTRPRTLLNSFYSGLYKVMGFRHVISTGQAHSEFKLVKNTTKYNKVSELEDSE